MTKAVDELRQQFPVLRQSDVDGNSLHYLDNAAMSLLPQCVIDAVSEFDAGSRANVQRGIYRLAGNATAAYDNARSSVAKFLNAGNPEEIVFTSGATAAINLVAYSYGSLLGPEDEVLISEAEHHSNYLPWKQLCDRQGVSVKVLPVDKHGLVQFDQLEQVVTERCKLIALGHVSNITGAIADVRKVVAVARKVGARVLLDGAQAVPHGNIDVQALGVDFYVFSGHKCFAPTGVGVLWARKECLDIMPPFMTGGGMVERVAPGPITFAQGSSKFEAGTPPITQAVGMGVALDWLQGLPLDELHQHEMWLGGKLVGGLRNIPGLKLLGSKKMENCQPVFSFDVEGIHPHDICHILDEEGVALRGGHHCAQPLLDSLGLNAVSRASLLFYNNEDDINALLSGLKKAIDILA